MASFLNNSGDIILDAVLTDYGRQLLAKGDGSFNITKFAFGDDEIDYSLWDANQTTALKDVEILGTPILEAFTNNAASMKSKLLTLNIENLLYLPILKLNTNIFNTSSFNSQFTGFVVPIDDSNNTTTTSFTPTNSVYLTEGLVNYSNLLTIDQGIDSSDTDNRKSLEQEIPELYEKEYNIIMDNRLGTLASSINGTPETPVSIDDDNMATYKVSLTSAGGFVTKIPANGTSPTQNAIINGYQGTRLQFTVLPTRTVENNNILDRLGEQLQINPIDPTAYYRTVRTSVTVVGITTGYSVEIPVLFAKKV